MMKCIGKRYALRQGATAEVYNDGRVLLVLDDVCEAYSSSGELVETTDNRLDLYGALGISGEVRAWVEGHGTPGAGIFA